MDDKPGVEATTLADDDLNTTAPQSQPTPWRMPEPVFRKTSGKLPEGFERNYGGAVADAPEASSDGDSRVSSSADDNPSNSYVEPTPKSSILKILLVVLGLAAMTAFLVVFLTVVYFFFLR